MLVLSLEDLMLHLCLHAVQHILEGVGLRLLCDLTETMKHYQAEMDWQKIQDRSRQWGTDRPLYLMLSLIRELAGQAAPSDILDILTANPVDARFVAGLIAHIMVKLSGCPALTTDSPGFGDRKAPQRG